MYNVLIVEDNSELGESLKILLSREGYDCRLAKTAGEAEKFLEQSPADICILDITLPDGNGISFCRKIRKENIKMAILFVTADDREESIVQGFAAGGDDYLVKPFRSRELLARMTAVLRRSYKDSEKWLVSGDMAANFKEMKLLKGEQEISLRPMEFALLKLLMERSGSLLKRENIFAILWDNDEKYVEENNLSVLASRLRSKLGDYQGKPYFETIWGIGYRWSLPVAYEEKRQGM